MKILEALGTFLMGVAALIGSATGLVLALRKPKDPKP
jgi:hypothetical protein